MEKKEVVITTSWDDGSAQDEKLAELLIKYKLPATFYIPHLVCELDKQAIVDLSKDFEIGGHTSTHPLDMKRLTYDMAEDEVIMNKQALEDMIDKEVTSFCYPRGRYNQLISDIVKSAGFTNARTTDVLCIEHPTNIFRTRTTVHAFRDRNEYEGKYWLDVAKKLLQDAVQQNGYFHLWGHGWEVEKHNLWEELEELFILMYEYNNN